MTLSVPVLKAALKTQILSKKTFLKVEDEDEFELFAEALSDAIATAVINDLTTNAVPVVNDVAGVLT